MYVWAKPFMVGREINVIFLQASASLHINHISGNKISYYITGTYFQYYCLPFLTLSFNYCFKCYKQNWHFTQTIQYLTVEVKCYIKKGTGHRFETPAIHHN